MKKNVLNYVYACNYPIIILLHQRRILLNLAVPKMTTILHSHGFNLSLEKQLYMISKENFVKTTYTTIILVALISYWYCNLPMGSCEIFSKYTMLVNFSPSAGIPQENLLKQKINHGGLILKDMA